ncbi:MAG TPA: hypothetical protein DIC60_01850 [Lachnospiraceae bacterium]|nr:hypothetical protein [Lachnospiraceae bacterium]
MKKKISLLLAAIMVVGMIPATAFAVTTNTVSKIVTGGVDDNFTADTAPVFKIAEKNLEDETASTVTFKATLSNAEFNFIGADTEPLETGDEETIDFGYGDTTIKMLASNIAMITGTIDGYGFDTANIKFPIASTLKSDGEATITIDPLDSVITAGTYKFANVVTGSTTTTIEKTVDISEAGGEIKPIVITETSKGAMEYTGTGYLKLKLTSGFTYATDETVTVTGYTGSEGPVISLTDTPVVTAAPASEAAGIYCDSDAEEMYIKLPNFSTSTTAMTLSISGINVEYDEDDIAAGDVAEITVSGYDMTKATVEVAVAKTFAVTFTAENKTLPVFYSGRQDAELDTLKVTMKEVIADSWLDSRKTTITFPTGVKIIAVDPAYKEGLSDADLSVENNVLTISNPADHEGKAKIEFTFQLSIAPDFTGDITAVLGGSAIEEDVEAVLGTAVAPITVKAESNPVSIDYRNVAIGDIVITEAYAGALEKGKTLRLELEDISFDGTPTVEVVEGDIKIDNVDAADGILTIDVKTASSKTPAVLKITNNELFLNRSIPAGSYALKLIAGEDTLVADDLVTGINVGATSESNDACDNAFFQNSVVKGGTHKKTVLFDTRSVTVLDNFVEVVTAGRDQDDSTFTTTISVAIGADKIIAGTKEIALDVPAYIANGYTMLPVRGVTEALSTVAIVRWDDATKTVTITFGARVISMTVGSKTMNINGVPVQMQAACEITDSRAFIPLRDLGYALGLNDSKINWDDTTKTATLN